MKARTWLKIGTVLAVVAVLLWLRSLPLTDWLTVFNERIQQLGPAGLLVYALAYAVATVLLLPGSLLTLAAGAAFGLFPGFASVLVGASVGAALSFLVSRHLGRRRVEVWIRSKPRFSAVDRAVAKEGWKIVFLTRLSPIFPFNFQNYAYGLTRIPFWHYALSSAIGIIPGTFLYVYLGTVGRSGLEAAAGGGEVETLRLIVQVVGLVATAAVTVYITRIATKALKETGV
ncbi:MAG: TVP38/TMEM64 family protein [Vicinamibacteria bacterium]